MRGPIDYIVVAFTNHKLDGRILSAISEAVDSGAIGLVALAALAKDADGVVTQLNIGEFGDDVVAELSQKHPTDNTLVTDDDIKEVGDLLEPNTAAGLLIVEQLWALPLKKALLDANGVVVAEGRIHPEAAVELENKEAL